MKNSKKDEQKNPQEKKGQKEKEKEGNEKPALPKLRQVVIVTDGIRYRLIKTECTVLELKAILQDLLKKLGEN